MVDGEKLRYKYLSESDASRLYSQLELPPSPKAYCPTCFKEGSYVYEGVTYQCDCELQYQLFKHYMNAGIGKTYQRLDWGDFEGDPQALQMAELFWDRRELFVQRGLGLIFLGEFGTGKTMLQTLLAKDLVKTGYSVFCVKFSSMIDMFTSGWRSQEDREFFQRKVKGSQVLVIDDLGKEFKASNNLSGTTLDDVLRTRVQEGRTTLITSNLNTEEMDNGYGPAIFSLLKEVSMIYEFRGEDYRTTANRKAVDEALKGEIRPIV